jgi:hypothetical protein
MPRYALETLMTCVVIYHVNPPSARLLSETDQKDAADSAWHMLIHLNPEYHAYYRDYLSTKGIDLCAWASE